MTIIIEFQTFDSRIQIITNLKILSETERKSVTDFIEFIKEQKYSFFRDFEFIIRIEAESITICEQDNSRLFEVPGYNFENLCNSLSAFNKEHLFWIEDVDADFKDIGWDFGFNPDDYDEE